MLLCQLHTEAIAGSTTTAEQLFARAAAKGARSWVEVPPPPRVRRDDDSDSDCGSDGMDGEDGEVRTRASVCRAVPCRAVPCRAVRARACMRLRALTISYPRRGHGQWGRAQFMCNWLPHIQAGSAQSIRKHTSHCLNPRRNGTSPPK